MLRSLEWHSCYCFHELSFHMVNSYLCLGESPYSRRWDGWWWVRWVPEQVKLLQLGALCKGVRNGAFQPLWGHQPAAAAADVHGRVEPLVLIPPLCPVWSLLTYFLASEEPSG